MLLERGKKQDSLAMKFEGPSRVIGQRGANIQLDRREEESGTTRIVARDWKGRRVGLLKLETQLRQMGR